MKSFFGFVVLILVVSGEVMKACHLEAAVIDEPQTATIRIDHEVSVENKRILDILLEVLHGTGVSGGFAEISNCSNLPQGSLKLKQGTTLREAMDALVARNPTYQWRLEDGVVNLMPRNDVPLLDTRIVKFQTVTTDLELPIVFQDLLRLPEMRKREAQLGLTTALGQGGPGVAEEHPVSRQPMPIHINVENLSIREAFNKVVRTSQKGLWVYQEANCNGDKKYSVQVVPIAPQ